MGVRVTGVSVLFNSINVGKILQTLPKVTLFCSGICVGEPAARVTGISAILNNFSVAGKPRTLSKVAVLDNGLVEETFARVTGISVLFNSINVANKLQAPAANTFFDNVFIKRGSGKMSIQATRISATLHGFNIEENQRILAKVAVLDNGFVEETFARVTWFFNNINVEEKPQKLAKNSVLNNELDVELKGGVGK